MKWRGTIRQIDLGSGGFMLVQNGGNELELIGELSGELVGRLVEVHGTLVSDSGFLMTGADRIEVRSIQCLDAD
jgi:hypothetical protein